VDVARKSCDTGTDTFASGVEIAEALITAPGRCCRNVPLPAALRDVLLVARSLVGFELRKATNDDISPLLIEIASPVVVRRGPS